MFLFIADGTKLVRVRDESRYPAHALYVGGQYRAKRSFRDGIEWTRGGVGQAFAAFATESELPRLKPLVPLKSFGYDESFE